MVLPAATRLGFFTGCGLVVGIFEVTCGCGEAAAAV